jgi:hypothetical protein
VANIKVFKNDSYSKILLLVEKGFTIQKSCELIGIGRDTLYRNIDKQQLLELSGMRTITKSVSCQGHWVLNEMDYILKNHEEI